MSAVAPRPGAPAPVPAARALHPSTGAILAGVLALSGALAALYLIWEPMSADLAAQTYRTGLFEREGFTIWNGQWYGGHHTPGYSLLFPPVASLLGLRLAGALSAVAAAALFVPLARHHFGPSAWLGCLWFAAAASTSLFTGRLAFAFGVPFAIAAMLALQRGRVALAALLAALATLASPVAGVFAALGGAALIVGPRRRAGLAVAAAALGPALLLSVLFPEGGVEPFALSAYLFVPLACGAALAIIPREERELRAGVVLYVVGVTLAWILPTPVGGNAARLGALVAGPLAALVLWPDRRVLLALLALPLLYWQWVAPVRDIHRAQDDPAVRAGYYAPLLAELRRQDGPPGRVEVVWTVNHWESAYVAPSFPLARGWERQLDVKYGDLFYEEDLGAESYRRWLDSLAVRWVALPLGTRLDYSSRAEARLVRGGLPYLREVWRNPDWRLYAVRDPAPLASGPARVTALGAETVTLRASGPGRVRLRVRWTPYWSVVSGSGCVERDGDWTALTVRRAGEVRLAPRFDPLRAGASGPRCA